MIPKDKIDEILTSAKVEEVIADFYTLSGRGKTKQCECPMCGKTGKRKGLQVTPSKGIYKCFSCGWGGSSPVNFLMDTQKMVYPDVLRYLADKYNVLIDDKPRQPQKKGKKIVTFCEKQLKGSGLTEKDIKARVYVDDDTEKEVAVFQPGTRDQYDRIVKGDDMVIWYYDLEGRPVMYKKPKGNRMEHLCRVRWQNPALHTDHAGNSMKYSSPYGSGSHIYIPEVIRRIYQEGRAIKRLYLQEGEKKSEKACKHGIPSVGVMGINNIGQKGRLPAELQLIVQRCKVEEVVFIFDADWKELSGNLKPGQRVDLRPRSFFFAVKNFRDFFKTFVNMGIYIDSYFGALRTNENKDKGIDDILVNGLKGKETELKEDIEKALNEKTGDGKYIQMHKVSVISDLKLQELWDLDNAENFAQAHKATLKELPEFKIGKHSWRFNKEGRLELAQPLNDNEQFWEKYITFDRSGNERLQYRFRYLYAYNFFRNRGYGRIMMASGSFQFCHIHNRVVEITEPYAIKDFAMELTKEIVPQEEKVDVMDMLYRGGKMYFGPDSLSNIDFVQPTFEVAGKDYQNLYFKNKFWEITADKIVAKNMADLENFVWSDKINDFEAKLLDPIIKIRKITKDYLDSVRAAKEAYEHIGKFDIEWSKEGEDCHFAQFLWNTGEFNWKKFTHGFGKSRQEKDDERSLEEMMETGLHFVNKMSAMGYLLHQFFDKSKAKAVIGMDGKLSEVGNSNGGSGKSIFGDAIGQIIPQVSIGAKSKKLTEDPFIFEEVCEKTDSVFLDDVRANIDFEFLFPYITGKFLINQKGIGKFTIPDFETPKLYISTNHAMNGEGSSFRRRQFFIAFSDYYNDKHVPVDDFGINFFDEWDSKQKNLFYNFMAICLQVYLKYGLIDCPMERLEQRRLRQKIGEDFLQWADTYYSYDEVQRRFLHPENVGRAIPRKELYDSFIELNPLQRKYTPSRVFKEKFKAYCHYRNGVFNPNKFQDNERKVPGGNHKTGGVEYFTLVGAEQKY